MQLPSGQLSGLARLLAIPLGALAFVAAFVVGAVAWAVLLGVALVGGTALAVTVWWKTRHLRRELREQMEQQAGGPAGETHVIEGEYTVVRGERRRDEQPRQ